MGFMKDFKAFAMKGSVIDLAVGVVIGGAFGKIVTAMVDDVIKWMAMQGWEVVSQGFFSDNGADGDLHFRKIVGKFSV